MTWLPVSIFAICCLAQFWFGQRVASALEIRHPSTYREIYGMFAWNRLFWFALTRGDKNMGDADLTARTKQFQLLIFVALASWLAIVAFLMTGHR